ncbi:hypothetical protein B4129_3042 [Bacillus safensis]|nr:hypothetical protein B4129_3042 [Bacillus safensis]
MIGKASIMLSILCDIRLRSSSLFLSTPSLSVRYMIYYSL